MAYEGSCHCGTVTFTVEGEQPATAISCNCSHCRRKGLLLAFVEPGELAVRGEDALETYRFNTGTIAHRICRTCGTEPFATGATPGGGAMAAVNLRCVPAIDPDVLTLHKVDGASL